jgi:hypothetical protein
MFFFAGVSFLKGRAWGRSWIAFSAFSIKWTLLNMTLKFFSQFLALYNIVNWKVDLKALLLDFFFEFIAQSTAMSSSDQ